MFSLKRVVAALAVLAIGVMIGTLVSAKSVGTAIAASGRCSNASLVGSYGIRFEGKSKALGSFASVSLWNFNGNGAMTASESYDSDKTGPQTRNIVGTYKVSGDCRFQLFFASRLVHGHQANGACVLVANRKQFFCLDVEKGWVTTGTGSHV
jgi:hypothetical protein